MSWFHRHKWVTIGRDMVNVWGVPKGNYPMHIDHLISQQCAECGEEVIRKYRT